VLANDSSRGFHITRSAEKLRITDAPSEANDSTVAAVDRALAILDAFRTGDNSLSLADLAERTGLYKSTVHRLAITLEKRGYLARASGGGYRIGFRPFALGALFQKTVHAPDIIMPALAALSAITNESSSFMVRQGDNRICLYRVDSAQPVRDLLQPGDLKPLERGAAGRVLLAFTKPYSNAGRAIRDTMQATSFEELSPGVASIAAPIFDGSGAISAALVIGGPLYRFDKKQCAAFGKAILDAAYRLTLDLGGDAALFEAHAAARQLLFEEPHR
jgi:DNA-binding IclR family transcriptional regulator